MLPAGMQSGDGGVTVRSTGRGTGVQLVAAFSCCSDDPKNSDGGHITGLAIDQRHHILAVDNDAGVVKVFNQMGAFQYSFGKGLLVEPWDAFITTSGKIAVSDPGAGDLKVFSHSGKYLLNSERGFHLHEPYGVDYHPWSKETAVADKMFSCVFLHAPQGTVKDIVTKYGGGDSTGSSRTGSDSLRNSLTGNDAIDDGGGGQLKVPKYVCFDYAANLYVTDSGEHRLHAYDTELQHVFTYGAGSGDEELNCPAGVAVDRYGNILVADRGHSRVLLLDKQGRRKMCLLTWEDGIVEPQAIALTEEGQLVMSEGSTGLIKIFSYTHLPQVTAAVLPAENEELASNDDGASLKSADSHEDLTPERKPHFPPPSHKSSSTDVESFKRSLQMLQTGSDEDYKKSLGFPMNSKSGWSQVSSHHFQSVPSTAAPRGLAARKQRLAEINQEYACAAVDALDSHGMSSSTPNIRAGTPPRGLTKGGKHLSDITRPVFKLDSRRTGRDSMQSLDNMTPFSTSRDTGRVSLV